jgi:hypothetical protein
MRKAPLYSARDGVPERIGCLARHVEELDVPIIAVESGTLDRLDVSDLRGKWIASCGLYGGYCVRESVHWLRAKRIRVIQVRDAIVWPPGEKPSGSLATVLFPRVYFPPWLNANIGSDHSPEYPLECDAAFERAAYFGRDS